MADPLILLVDDEPGEQDLLEVACEEVGMAVRLEQVMGGGEALRRLADPGKERPRLILLDLNMPGLHGLQVLEQLRSGPELASVPIVVYTTSDAPEMRRRSHELGADAVLIKASTLDGMAALVSRLKPLLARSGDEAQGPVEGGGAERYREGRSPRARAVGTHQEPTPPSAAFVDP